MATGERLKLSNPDFGYGQGPIEFKASRMDSYVLVKD